MRKDFVHRPQLFIERYDNAIWHYERFKTSPQTPDHIATVQKMIERATEQGDDRATVRAGPDGAKWSPPASRLRRTRPADLRVRRRSVPLVFRGPDNEEDITRSELPVPSTAVTNP